MKFPKEKSLIMTDLPMRSTVSIKYLIAAYDDLDEDVKPRYQAKVKRLTMYLKVLQSGVTECTLQKQLLELRIKRNALVSKFPLWVRENHPKSELNQEQLKELFKKQMKYEPLMQKIRDLNYLLNNK